MAGTGALLALVMIGAWAAAATADTFALGLSPQIPAAEGKAKINNTSNGNVEIKLSVKHLASPGRIVPGAEVFVVWARNTGEPVEAHNLGALKVDKNLNGKIKAVTSMSSFDLFITCETTQTVNVPSAPELLPLHYLRK
jgi:hypothetical protein